MNSTNCDLPVHTDLQLFRRRCMGDLGLRVFTTFTAHVLQRGSRPAVLHLDYHVARLLASVRELSIGSVKWDEQALGERVIEELLRHFEREPRQAAAEVRLVASAHGTELCISPQAHPPAAALVLERVDIERCLPEHKTTSAAGSLEARRRAFAAGAGEALLVDRCGIVREGAWSNLFWFDRRGKLHTPGHLVLPGVTRRIVTEIIECSFDDVSYDQLLAEAREVFLTKSTSGITPVAHIGQRAFPAPGPGTVELMQAFDDYCLRYNEQFRT